MPHLTVGAAKKFVLCLSCLRATEPCSAQLASAAALFQRPVCFASPLARGEDDCIRNLRSQLCDIIAAGPLAPRPAGLRFHSRPEHATRVARRPAGGVQLRAATGADGPPGLHGAAAGSVRCLQARPNAAARWAALLTCGQSAAAMSWHWHQALFSPALYLLHALIIYFQLTPGSRAFPLVC